MQVAGLNHFIFVRQILHKGKEWLPEVIAEINAGRDPLVPRNIPPFRWPSHLLQGLGADPLRLSALLLHERRSAAPGAAGGGRRRNPRGSG